MGGVDEEGRGGGVAVAAAGAGVCGVKLQGPAACVTVICMINNLRYAQKHRSSSPDYGRPGKPPDDGFSRRVQLPDLLSRNVITS